VTLKHGYDRTDTQYQILVDYLNCMDVLCDPEACLQ